MAAKIAGDVVDRALHQSLMRKIHIQFPKKREIAIKISTSLIKHERIITGRTRAAFLKVHGDYMIELAKRGDYASYLEAREWVIEKDLLPKLFGSLAVRHAGRDGNYTRVFPLPAITHEKDSDGKTQFKPPGELCVVEFVENPFPKLIPDHLTPEALYEAKKQRYLAALEEYKRSLADEQDAQ